MDKDISTLLRELKAATKWSEPRIASEIGTSQPTVNRILNGQNNCKANTFRSIDALHKVHCGDASDLTYRSSNTQSTDQPAPAEKAAA